MSGFFIAVAPSRRKHHADILVAAIYFRISVISVSFEITQDSIIKKEIMIMNNISKKEAHPIQPKEFIVIDMKKEYGKEYVGPPWMIATSLSKDVLIKKYPKLRQDHPGFELIPYEVGEVIQNGTREMDRLIKRDARYETLSYEACTEYEFFLSLYDLYNIKKAKNEKIQKQINVLKSAIKQLYPAQRRRFEMRYWDNLSVREIAKIEGVSPACVSHSISAAHKRLHKILQTSTKQVNS